MELERVEIPLTNIEKIESLKDSIYQLYSKEGRSISYISRLLKVGRSRLASKIKKEWKFPEPETVNQMKPSTQKFINKHRQYIKSQLDKDVPITEIAKELGCRPAFISNSVGRYDPVIKKAIEDKERRMHQKAEERRENMKNRSRLEYDFQELEGEIWKQVLGYPRYQISNLGRVKSYSETYSSFYLLKCDYNTYNNRWYVNLRNEGKQKTFNLARLVAHHFCDGFSETNNTVNHKDGNTHNNRAENLEWVSQGENNLHAYRVLGREIVRKNKSDFEKVIYQGKYEFKTVAALARFIGKSETQTRRYLEEPEKHDLEIIP